MIKLENISYTYQKGTPFERDALSNVSLEIADGTLSAIIGHTGSGKSTLIQLIAALIPPTDGRIFVDGEDITAPKADLKKLHRTVGLVFQYPEHQLFEETVYKDISFGPKNMGLSDEEIDARVKQSCLQVGLKEKYLERSPFELSGGQKRRAAIAGVLAMQPKALILDEPTAGLDPKGRDEILNIIKNLHETHKDMIIIFVSHSMEDVAKTAENVIVMNGGGIEMQGRTEEIFSRAQRLREIGLNIPQITILADRLRKAGMDIPENIYTVRSAAAAIAKALGGERSV